MSGLLHSIEDESNYVVVPLKVNREMIRITKEGEVLIAWGVVSSVASEPDAEPEIKFYARALLAVYRGKSRPLPETPR